MTNSYQAVFVMPFLHFNPPDSGKDAYENSLALLCRPVSVISEIWLPPKFHIKGDHNNGIQLYHRKKKV